jgi:hypothetical protein
LIHLLLSRAAPNHQAYVDIVKRAVDELLKEGFMLPDDSDVYIAAAQRKNPLDSATVI